jgi:hypothetical protein
MIKRVVVEGGGWGTRENKNDKIKFATCREQEKKYIPLEL